MKIEITPPSKIEAEAVEVLATGLSIKPLFFGNGLEAATVGVVKVYSNAGDLVYMGILRVSGAGKPVLQERTKPVTPRLDRPRKGKG
jgi:hypothetical protein